MNKIVIYLIVCFLFAASVFAVEKNEFVQLVENTDHCFDCHTIYKITKADDAPLTKLGLDFRDVKGDFVLPDYDIGYLTSENYSEMVDVYEPCTESKTIINNDTGLEESVEFESSCYSGQKEVEKTREYYVFSGGDPIGALKDIQEQYNSASVGDSIYIKVAGHPERGTALDNILTLNDYSYDEYSWWNSSFLYRLSINCSQVIDGLPVVINGSNGFSIGGYQQVVWVACENNTGLAVYYNNYSSYVVADDSGEVDFEVESGDVSSFSNSLWQGFNFTIVYHFSNTTGNIGYNSANNSFNASNSGVSYLSDWDYGSIGGGVFFDGTSYMNAGSYASSNNEAFTAFAIFRPYRTTSTGSDDTLLGYARYSSPVYVYQCGGPQINMGNKFGCFMDPKYYIDGSPSLNNTYLLTYVYNGTNLTQYVNTSVAVSNGSISYTGQSIDFAIGRAYPDYAGNYIFGRVDEVRVRRGDFSSDWVNQVYYNFLGTAGFGTLGSEETYTPPAANESSGMAAIVAGLDASEVVGSYTAYDDRQVYVRLLNGSQYKGTFDKFVTVYSGGAYKRWAFNYDQNTSSSFPVFYNITPVFYVWQMSNITYDQIMWNVSALINSTYS